MVDMWVRTDIVRSSDSNAEITKFITGEELTGYLIVITNYFA